MKSNPYSPSQVTEASQQPDSVLRQHRHPAIFIACLLAGAFLPILGFVIAESVDNLGTNIAWLFIYLPALLAGMAVTLVSWFRAYPGWQRALAFMAFAWNLLITGGTVIFSFKMLIAR
jgi:predicted membrane channel-forming protein YqfA (hemolysin III family)